VRDGQLTPLPGKTTIQLQSGDTLRIETPGGGGWGDGGKQSEVNDNH
jgi:N-methylhydantoinase B/oxoprolinase/acetone carboxylase alpha subunit